jgi:phage baseplate assembly protein W
MAIVVTKTDIFKNPNYKDLGDYAFGLSLPIQMGEVTFVKNYDFILQLKSNVTNLLRTQRGERINQPLFGTNLQKILFEPFDDDIENKILDAISNAVRIWVPQLIVAGVEVDTSQEMKDKNLVEVKVKFNVVGQNSSFTTNFLMNSNK